MGIKIGDVVILRSGGPRMTVDGFGMADRNVVCVWFDEKDVKRSTFSIEGLEIIDEK